MNRTEMIAFILSYTKTVSLDKLSKKTDDQLKKLYTLIIEFKETDQFIAETKVALGV